MNDAEEEALIVELRRRGEKVVTVEEISCTIEAYRAGARRIGRRHGWRIRTFVVADGAAVVVSWVDRPTTALEREALRRTLAQLGDPTRTSNYDDMLAQVRRENLSVVRDTDSPST